ncbi:MAG TPA: 4'-phosphopantetheinyl transferase superfamily protein [Pseudonocardiaceae bacterium]
MFERLLPAEVHTAEILGEDPTATLLPEEQVLVARAVEKRRREVTHARTCARRALRELGHPAAPIPRGAKGEPVWPSGVVGSITHTAGFYAAAVADAGRVRSVGIDAEVHDRLPDGVLERIAIAEELAWLKELGRHGGVWWERMLFSAKESVYKTWFPLTRRWLGFEDALITVQPDAGTFAVRLLVDGSTVSGPPLTTLSGRYLVDNGYVLTAITLPH